MTNKIQQHTFTLQVMDSFAFPVENTKFDVTVDVVHKGREVTLHFPLVNFQIGQCAAIDPYCSMPSNGFLITVDAFSRRFTSTIHSVSALCSSRGNGYVGIGLSLPPAFLPPPHPPDTCCPSTMLEVCSSNKQARHAIKLYPADTAYCRFR